MSARFVLPFYVCMRKKRQGKGLEPWNWLQVIFHLQKRQPPVLPPLHVLFQQPPDAVSERPMHAGKTQDFSHLQASFQAHPRGVLQREAHQTYHGTGSGTVSDLFLSYICQFTCGMSCIYATILISFGCRGLGRECMHGVAAHLPTRRPCCSFLRAFLSAT